MKLLVKLILSAFAALMIGCSHLEEKPHGVAFSELYEPIQSDEAYRFLEQGIAILRRDYAPLEFTVRSVSLYRSKKNTRGARYHIAEGFSRTEIVDSAEGAYAIYIAVPPSDPEFYPILAHEIGHLKQPSLVEDWDMEGFCMVFSELLCEELGKDWSVWKERFHSGSSDPYAKAYHKVLLEMRQQSKHK